MKTTTELIKKLRSATTVASILDCRKALEEAEGDYDKAVILLREKELKEITKRSKDDASNGGLKLYLQSIWGFMGEPFGRKMGGWWVGIGYLILTIFSIWLINSNSEKMGNWEFVAYLFAFIIMISLLKTEGVITRQPSKYARVKKTRKLGGGIIISCIARDGQQKEIDGHDYADGEDAFMRQVEKIVLDKEEFYLLDEKAKRLYESKYEQIWLVSRNPSRNSHYTIFTKKDSEDKTSIPLPTWSTKFNREIIKILSERANLGEGKVTGGFRGEPEDISYYRQ